MLSPIIISSVIVLAVVILCLVKPNAGRIFLGFFFLLMAIAVNGSFTFTYPQAYMEYAGGALIPFYRDIALAVVNLNVVLFGSLLIVFEIIMGLMLLHKGKYVKIGLVGTMLFLVGIAPLSYMQFPWLGLIIGEVYLLTKDFETSFLETVYSKLRRRGPQDQPSKKTADPGEGIHDK